MKVSASLLHSWLWETIVHELLSGVERGIILNGEERWKTDRMKIEMRKTVLERHFY